jgi:hypothetical protein
MSPFDKYVSMNSNDTELLSGWFYSESYDMKIKDPTKEFLFVMDIYLDKTGKSAGIHFFLRQTGHMDHTFAH